MDKFLLSKRGQRFNLLKECQEYCEQDAVCLFLAVLSFEKTVLEQSAFHVSFLAGSGITLASLSALLFRAVFMQARIGLYPAHGYSSDKQSLIANGFFAFANTQRAASGLELIRYSKSSISSEYKWGNLRVDGATTGALFEFYGYVLSHCALSITFWVQLGLSCFYHYCDSCLAGRNMGARHPLYQRLTWGQLRLLDIQREERLTCTCQAGPYTGFNDGGRPSPSFFDDGGGGHGPLPLYMGLLSGSTKDAVIIAQHFQTQSGHRSSHLYHSRVQSYGTTQAKSPVCDLFPKLQVNDGRRAADKCSRCAIRYY